MYSLRKVPNCQASIMLASIFGKAFSLLPHENSNPRISKLWVLCADFIRTSIFTSLGQCYEKYVGMFKRRTLEKYMICPSYHVQIHKMHLN
jgi:hypothetical protein